MKDPNKHAQKLAEEAKRINEMKYPKSRMKRAEELRNDLKKIKVICGAIDSRVNKICTEPPAEGSTNGRCARHGGLSTGAVTEEGKQRALANLHPQARMVHGLYSRFVMTTEEMDFYATMMNHYIEELDLDPANTIMLDRALRNFILNQRKEVAEAYEIINEVQFDIDYDSKFLKYMQALGLDRKFNVSKEHKDNKGDVDLSMIFDMGNDEK
ncbi:hypothetical protein CHCC5027_3572 [Bacillus paralicheniformis]|uniref:HGGxSTG domain-containing protein n=1 Tax=Bacillus paralicheniformis TaxID=1648923 RepID=UPI00119E0B19|nr:HGGxSTG domain-containing protein [Bacillus paralicheniformis]TWJ39659.1 hypothetical protein CHCC5027_3572 [Bacillus paralicheniformis]